MSMTNSLAPEFSFFEQVESFKTKKCPRLPICVKVRNTYLCENLVFESFPVPNYNHDATCYLVKVFFYEFIAQLFNTSFTHECCLN